MRDRWGRVGGRSRLRRAGDFATGLARLVQVVGDTPPSSAAGCWLSEGKRLTRRDDVRVTTALNRLLGLPGASVSDVCFGGEGVIVCVRLRRRRRVCAVCGQTGSRLVVHDRRVKRWRHLDLGSTRCAIECELRLLRCSDCRVVRTEPVPWARPGAHHTRDFEDVVAWLAQQMAKTPICGLLRIGWDTVGRIVARVVADHLDDARLTGLVAIGVDEISYRRGQRYLTSVVDHQTGAIVWCSPGRNAATLQAFFTELGERRRSIRAVSIDMSGGYEKAIRDSVPDAEIAFDPFSCGLLGQRAVDQVRRDEWNAHERSHTPKGRWIKNARWSLLKSPDKQSIPQLALLGEVAQANKAMFRAFLLKEELRLRYHLPDPRLQRTSTPGSHGPHAHGSSRSSSSPARSAATATASSPRSASASATDASRASTAASA
jgi:transposase